MNNNVNLHQRLQEIKETIKNTESFISRELIRLNIPRDHFDRLYESTYNQKPYLN